MNMRKRDLQVVALVLGMLLVLTANY